MILLSKIKMLKKRIKIMRVIGVIGKVMINRIRNKRMSYISSNRKKNTIKAMMMKRRIQACTDKLANTNNKVK